MPVGRELALTQMLFARRRAKAVKPKTGETQGETAGGMAQAMWTFAGSDDGSARVLRECFVKVSGSAGRNSERLRL